MKFQELQGKKSQELKELIVEKRKELLGLRFQKVNGQMKDTSQYKKARKIIAQIQTILYQSPKA